MANFFFLLKCVEGIQVEREDKKDLDRYVGVCDVCFSLYSIFLMHSPV